MGSLSFLNDQGIALQRLSWADEDTNIISDAHPMSESEVLSALQVFLFTPLHIQNLFHLFALVKKLPGKNKRITKMWGVYSLEYFSQNFMSENCRVVNQQDIDRDRDRDIEVCLYWAICNMIWKLSWRTYGNCFVNPVTKTKIASSSHSHETIICKCKKANWQFQCWDPIEQNEKP